ncbi:MAG: carbohydrate kinase family protein [Pseudomonadota bacterium]
MSAHSVLVLGAASWNRMVHVDTLPQGREATIFAGHETEAAGSTGVGKAMVAAALGHATTLHCALGKDRHALQIKEACAARGIVTLVDEHDAPTPQHLNIMDQSGGRYSIFLSNGSETPVLDMDRLTIAIGAAETIFLSLAASSRIALPLLENSTAPVLLDLHNYDGQNPWYDPFIAAADVIQLSNVALTNPRPVVDRLLAGRAQQVILTKGGAGAEIFTPAIHHCASAHPARFVDSNGAGDAFSVAFWHAQTTGASLAEAAHFASVAAAMAIETYDLFPAGRTLKDIALRAAVKTPDALPPIAPAPKTP